MLKDSTNVSRPPLLKTFQRKLKEPAAIPEEASLGGGLTCSKSSEGPHDTLPSPSKNDDPWLAEGCSGRYAGPTRCPGGLLQSLRDRRTSVVLRFSTALEAFGSKRQDGNRKGRDQRLAANARVAELVARIEEIDAFELTVEDPGPSPEPERHRRYRGYRVVTSGGALIRSDRAAQHRLGLARTEGIAAAPTAALAAAMPAPDTLGLRLYRSPMASAYLNAQTAPSAAAATAAATTISAVDPTRATATVTTSNSDARGLRDTHASANPVPHDVDSLVRNVCRLGIGESANHDGASGSAACRIEIDGRSAACSLVDQSPREDHGQQLKDLADPPAQLTCSTDGAGPDVPDGTMEWEQTGVAGSCNAPSAIKDSACLPNTVSVRRGRSRAHSQGLCAEHSADGISAPETPQEVMGAVFDAAGLPSTVSVRRGSRRWQSLPPFVEQTAVLACTESTPSTSAGMTAVIVRVARASSCALASEERSPVEGVASARNQLKSTGRSRLSMGPPAGIIAYRAEDGQQSAAQQVLEEEQQELEEQRCGAEQPQLAGTAADEMEVDGGACLGGANVDALPDMQGQPQLQPEQQLHLDREPRAGNVRPDADGTAAPHQDPLPPTSRRGVVAGMCVLGHRISLAASTPSAALAAGTPCIPDFTRQIMAGAAERGMSAVAGAVEAASSEEWERAPRPSRASPVANGGEYMEAAAATQVPMETTAGRSPALPALTPLQSLLQLCGQEPTLERHQLPTMDDIIDRLLKASIATTSGQEGAGAGAKGRKGAAGRGRGAKAKRPALVKVGEGSYGEAWRLGDVESAGSGGGMVIKVVPIEGDMIFNDGPQKTAADMLSETLMHRELSALAHGDLPGGASSNDAASSSGDANAIRANWTAGFVRMHAVAVCRGPYSRDLVKAWERWDEEYGSENEPVCSLPPDQLFWVIAMENSGTDLEKYVLDSWDQLRSVLLQTGLSLAVAEAALEFEHRDLHWGNVLIRPVNQRLDCLPGGWLGARLRGRNLRVASCGLGVTIIDFTQSRLVTPNGSLAFCDLSQDPAVFEGTKGDVQFDTYRWMRGLVDDDWASSCPATNCLWLSYMAEVMSKRFGGASGGKGLRLTAAQKRSLREFRKRAVGYSSCSDLLYDELFHGLLEVDG